MQNEINCQPNPTWHNWGGNLTAHPAALCKPQTKGDLPTILKKARDEGKTIRVLGGGYSWTPMVPTDGYIIDMSSLNRLISVDKVKNQITVEAGMPISEVSITHAQNNGLSFQTETVIPWITVGGAVALGCHGTGYNMGTVSDEVVAMEVLLADGTWRTFSADTDGEEIMNAMRVSLGALGIIYSVTFQCVPSFNLKAVDVRSDMKTTIANIKNVITSHEYVEVFWFPFNEQAWIKTWDTTTELPTEGELKWGWDELKMFLEINTFGQRLMDLLNSPSWQRLTPWIMRLFSYLMPQQTVIAHSSLVFHYQLFYMPVWDMSYCINIPNNDFTLVQKAWMLVVERIAQLQKENKYPQNMVLHTRYIKNSNAYLSPASGEDHTCCIEILTFTGDNRPISEYENYFKEIEKGWILLGGKPHWGKAIYSVDKLKSMYGTNMDSFLNIRQQLDPDQIFINDFLKQVFQLQPLR